MRKSLYQILAATALLATTGIASADVLITEVADPGNEFSARFVELYNNGSSSVDLTGWGLERYANGNATETTIDLSPIGTLAAGDFAIIANSSTYDSEFNDTPDITNSTISGNGDDVYQLVDDSENPIDVFGEIGVDGTDEPWEYEDGRAERQASVTSANGGTFDVSNWNVTLGGQDAPDDFDPRAWVGAPSGVSDWTLY